MKRARLAIIVTLVIAVIASVLSFLVPVPSGNSAIDFYFNLIVALVTTILYIGGAVIITQGFSVVTSQLRRAYTIIFVGLILWAVAYLELPFMVLFNLFNNNLALDISAMPFVATSLLVFIGTRMLCKLVSVKSLATSWWFAIVAVGVVVTATVLAPHVPLGPGATEDGFDSLNGLIMAVATFFTLSAYHLLLVKRRASVTFTSALAWQSVSMFVLAWFGALGSTLVVYFVPGNSGASQLSIVVALVPTAVAAAMFVRSAFSFATLAESNDTEGMMVARNFFGKPLQAPADDETTSLDIVLYAAGLASNPQAIDTQLEVVRSLTSQLPTGQKPGQEAEQALMDTYMQIENYLVTKEPLRAFNKESLRQDIAQKLRLSTSSIGTFWAKLT